MKIIDAHGSFLTLQIVQEAQVILQNVNAALKRIVRMPPEQQFAWENLGIGISEIIVNIENDKSPLQLSELTCGGWPVKGDSWMLKDRIRFEVEGIEVLGIVNLGVPKEPCVV